MTKKRLWNNQDVKETLLSVLMTHYNHTEKEIFFKNKSVSRDIGISPCVLGHVCVELEEDGIISRYGSNPITWRTQFRQNL